MTDLTPRQKEVLELVGRQGLSAKEAAKKLGIEPTTIHNLCGRIHKKLGVRNIRQALAKVSAALLSLALALPALARDDGRWQSADPSLRDWVRGLTDRYGVSCCDEADSEEVEGWTFGPKGYKVKVLGQWLDVPLSAQLDIPNRLGFARVWLRYEGGTPFVRCFLAGAGG